MRRYGKNDRNPVGFPEDTYYFIAEIPGRPSRRMAGQCTYKRGHGPGGLYCTRHAKIIAEGGTVTVPEDGE